MGNLIAPYLTPYIISEQNKQLEDRIEKLRVEISQLSHALHKKEIPYERIVHTRRGLGPKSKDAIKDFVKQMVANEDINIRGIPDCVEKKIYTNVLTVILGLMQQLTNTTEIEFFGHKLIMRLIPDDD